MPSSERTQSNHRTHKPNWWSNDTVALSAQDARRLEAWFRGDLAITRQDAHGLLERALATGAVADGRFRVLPDG